MFNCGDFYSNRHTTPLAVPLSAHSGTSAVKFVSLESPVHFLSVEPKSDKTLILTHLLTYILTCCKRRAREVTMSVDSITTITNARSSPISLHKRHPSVVSRSRCRHAFRS